MSSPVMQTAAPDSHDGTQTLAALGDALAGIKAAIDTVETIIRSRENVTLQEVAEGYRSLISNLASTSQRVFTGFDLDHPRLVPLVNDFWRGAWTNPDSHITCAEILGAGEYRIIGSMGACADLNIEVLAGIGGYDEGPLAQISSLHARSIAFDADGRFEVYIGGSTRGANWMQSAPNATNVFIRQTLLDWQAPPPTLLIERLDTAGRPARPPRPADIARLLTEVSGRLLARYRACDGFVASYHKALPVNDVLLPSTGKAGLLPTQYSSMSQFALKLGEALLISTAPAITSYQSICIGHYHWFEAFDSRYVQGSLTTKQSSISSDGRFRYVVCAEDPKVANWLDTDGHERGLLMMRWQGLSGPPPEKPDVRVVKIQDIRAFFPADEAVFSEDERQSRQQQRRMSLFRRFP